LTRRILSRCASFHRRICQSVRALGRSWARSSSRGGRSRIRVKGVNLRCALDYCRTGW